MASEHDTRASNNGAAVAPRRGRRPVLNTPDTYCVSSLQQLRRVHWVKRINEIAPTRGGKAPSGARRWYSHCAVCLGRNAPQMEVTVEVRGNLPQTLLGSYPPPRRVAGGRRRRGREWHATGVLQPSVHLTTTGVSTVPASPACSTDLDSIPVNLLNCQMQIANVSSLLVVQRGTPGPKNHATKNI